MRIEMFNIHSNAHSNAFAFVNKPGIFIYIYGKNGIYIYIYGIIYNNIYDIYIYNELYIILTFKHYYGFRRSFAAIG